MTHVNRLFLDSEAKIKQLKDELAKQKKECEDTIAKLKEQFEKDTKGSKGILQGTMKTMYKLIYYLENIAFFRSGRQN